METSDFFIFIFYGKVDI